MKKPLLSFFGLAGLALALTGCETRVVDHGAYLPVNVSVNNLEDRVSVVLLERRVQNSVTIPGIQETRLPDGRLQVALNVRNRENRWIQVQASCKFKDAQGFPIDETPFVNVFLDGNAQGSAKFTSISDRVDRYTIQIREAH